MQKIGGAGLPFDVAGINSSTGETRACKAISQKEDLTDVNLGPKRCLNVFFQNKLSRSKLLVLQMEILSVILVCVRLLRAVSNSMCLQQIQRLGGSTRCIWNMDDSTVGRME